MNPAKSNVAVAGEVKEHSPTWVRSYLRLLHLKREAPSLDFLARLCRAHLATFSFENISKLIDHAEERSRIRLVPPVTEFLDQRERYQMGGTCYTLNYHLYQLLQVLGFESHLLPVGKDHMAISVSPPELDGERVYVDVGSAAPLDHGVRVETDPDNCAAYGNQEMYIRAVPDSPGTYLYSRRVDGHSNESTWTFSFTNTAVIDNFTETIQRSYRPDGPFMKILRCQLWQWEQNRNISLVNNRLTIRHRDGQVEKRTLGDREQIGQVLREEFAFPQLPYNRAIDWLESQGIDIFAEKKD